MTCSTDAASRQINCTGSYRHGRAPDPLPRVTVQTAKVTLVHGAYRFGIQCECQRQERHRRICVSVVYYCKQATRTTLRPTYNSIKNLQLNTNSPVPLSTRLLVLTCTLVGQAWPERVDREGPSPTRIVRVTQLTLAQTVLAACLSQTWCGRPCRPSRSPWGWGGRAHQQSTWAQGRPS